MLPEVLPDALPEALPVLPVTYRGTYVRRTTTTGSGAVTGTVEEVLLRTTRLRDADGTLWHIRNGEILSVGNRSQSSG